MSHESIGRRAASSRCLVAIVSLVTVGFVSGCGDDTPAELTPCNSHADCPDGQACIEKECRTIDEVCEGDEDCPEGMECDLVLESCVPEGSCTAICTAGDSRCEGDVLEACDEDGCAWTVAEDCSCGCEEGACNQPACGAGESRCNGNEVEICDSSGCFWERSESCACGCVGGSCTEPVCTESATRCSGDDLERCDTGGCGWSFVQTCACGCAGDSCIAPACSPGALRCNGKDVEECSADGCGWNVIESCSCGCSGGTCVDSLCTPEEIRCNGDAVEECAQTGCDWEVVESCRCGCSDGSCVAETCTANATRCNGDDLEQCDSAGCGWDYVQTCACGCASDTCVAASCTPGATRCSADGVEECDSDGCGWSLIESCPCGCREGGCIDSVCAAGNLRCNENLLEECDTAGCGWELVEDCGTGTCAPHGICVPEAWTCPVSYYHAGDGCDCECGAWDPDCDQPDEPVLGCSEIDDAVCAQPGVCVPSSWTCNVSFYDAEDGCDCDCGAWDPDCEDPDAVVGGCDGFTNPVCVHPGECASGDDGPPDSWTCDDSWYDADDGCDCECGAWDPDCDDPAQNLYNCLLVPDAVCAQPGVCVPESWTCMATWYDAEDGCDCECGAWDPDCDDPDQTLFRCGQVPDAVCAAPGLCVPSAWTCDATYYGASDGCDCNCGAWDPDCDDENQGVICWGESITDPLCVESGVCVPQSPPAEWTCHESFYNDGQWCDCECGAWDPDCSDSSLSLWDPDETCVACDYPGVCSG